MTVPVNCAHAQSDPQGNPHGVQCGLGLYGGRPSVGVCRNCSSIAKIDPAKPAVLVEVSVPRKSPPPVTMTPEQMKAAEEAAQKAQEAANTNNRAIWAEIHRRPWIVPQLVLADEQAFLESCIVRIAGDCSCKKDARKMVAEFPPDVSSREAMFKRYWEYHQTVNAKIGKAGISLEEAMTLYPAPR